MHFRGKRPVRQNTWLMRFVVARAFLSAFDACTVVDLREEAVRFADVA